MPRLERRVLLWEGGLQTLHWMEPRTLSALLCRLQHSISHMIWPPLPLPKLAARFEDYLRRVGIRKLQMPPGQWQPLQEVPSGRNTLVLRWETEKMGTVYARAWRYDLRVRPAREHASASAALTAAGLWVPPLLLVDDSPLVRREYRMEVVLELAARGQSFAQLRAPGSGGVPPEAIQALGRDLARMHTATSPTPGKPWRPDNEMLNPAAYWRGRLAKYERSIPAGLLELTPAQVDQIFERVARGLEQIHLGASHLVHGDLSPSHLFWDGVDQLTWIDFGTVCYGHPAQDLAAVRGWLQEDEALYRTFTQAYEATAGEAAWTRQAGAVDVFEQLRLLERLRTRIHKRAGLRGQKGLDRALRLEQEQRRVEAQLRCCTGL